MIVFVLHDKEKVGVRIACFFNKEREESESDALETRHCVLCFIKALTDSKAGCGGSRQGKTVRHCCFLEILCDFLRLKTHSLTVIQCTLLYDTNVLKNISSY